MKKLTSIDITNSLNFRRSLSICMLSVEYNFACVSNSPSCKKVNESVRPMNYNGNILINQSCLNLVKFNFMCLLILCYINYFFYVHTFCRKSS